MLKIISLSFGLIISAATITAHANTPANDCLLIETVDGATKLSNKCTETINLTWFYEGACAAGCTKQIGSKIKGVWEDLFKEPYTIGVCYAPEKVDPNWKGVGPATCDTSEGKSLAATTTNSDKSDKKTTAVVGTPATDIPVEVTGAGGVVKTAASNHKGEFHFDQLPPGKYELKINGKPFKSVTVSQNGILYGKLSKNANGVIEFKQMYQLTWK